MIKYIVFDSGSSVSQGMFYDIKKLNNVYETSDIFHISNPFIKSINKIHMSGKINSVINLPFRRIWDRCYVTETTQKNPEIDYIVIFTNVSVRKFRAGYLKKLENQENVKLVLIAVDPFVDKVLCPLDIMNKVQFDLVYSFDPDDCKKYNIKFINGIYSKRTDVYSLQDYSDIFFIGRVKDRYHDLLKIAREAHEAGLTINFQILGVKKKDQVQVPGITYLKKVVSYDKVLPMIMASKCLLDLYQSGQKGLTMRAYEAIVYNKKLITNNDYITKQIYYKPQYMQIFKRVDEIDFSFICQSQSREVDYKYKDEYSPIYFIREVEKGLRETGKLQ